MPLDQVDIDEQEQSSMSFLEHIDVLRKHLFRAAVAILLGALVAFLNPDILFDKILFGPQKIDFWSYRKMCDLSYLLYDSDQLCIKSVGFQVQNITMTGQFLQHITVSIFAGIVLAFPFVLWEIWKFIRPALKSSERRYTSGIVFVSSLLFLLGVAFGYFIISPISVIFLGNYVVTAQVNNIISLESYLSFVAMLSLASGLIFELPMFIYFLAKLGLVSSEFLSKYRRHAIIIILIIGAILTPPDVASQIILAIPIYILYEASILITKRIEKKRKDTFAPS